MYSKPQVAIRPRSAYPATSSQPDLKRVIYSPIKEEDQAIEKQDAYNPVQPAKKNANRVQSAGARRTTELFQGKKQRPQNRPTYTREPETQQIDQDSGSGNDETQMLYCGTLSNSRDNFSQHKSTKDLRD